MFGMLCCLMSSTSCFRWFGVLSLQTCSLAPPSVSSFWLVCLFLKVSSRWLFGWNTTAALCRYSNRVCSNGTAGCHDYTELPHRIPWLPFSPSTLFCLHLTPPTNILCLVQAPPHRHDQSLCLGLGQCQPPVVTKPPPRDIPSHIKKFYTWFNFQQSPDLTLVC